MIGIFGDSFCTPSVGNNHKTDLYHESWIYHLGKPVESYGKGATSQLWSYKQFLENHEKYERIIFCLTGATRFDHCGDDKSWNGNKLVVGYSQIEMILREGHWKNNKSLPWHDPIYWDIPRVKAFKEYLLHLQDNTADNLYAQLLIEGILSRRPDTIIIPLGEKPNWPWTYLPKTSCFTDYQFLQIRSIFHEGTGLENIKTPYDANLNFYENRLVNHFSLEINQLIAEHVRCALAGDGWKDWGVNDIVPIPHSRPWDYYYEPITI